MHGTPSLGIFLVMKIFIYIFFQNFLFLFLYIYHHHNHKQVCFQNLSSLYFRLFPIFYYKPIVVSLSNFSISPVIFKSFKHNGLIISLSLYPVMYLSELYLPYHSFLETNILLTSISSIWNICFIFICQSLFFFSVFVSIIFFFFPLILILCE